MLINQEVNESQWKLREKSVQVHRESLGGLHQDAKNTCDSSCWWSNLALLFIVSDDVLEDEFADNELPAVLSLSLSMSQNRFYL